MHLRELLSDSLAGASLYKKNTGKHEKIKKLKKVLAFFYKTIYNNIC